MRKEIILSKISEIEESVPLIAENMPEDFDKIIENIKIIIDRY